MSATSTPARSVSRWAAVRRWVVGRDVALGYAAIVVLVGFVLSILPSGVADRFVLRSSTNLVNLRDHPPYVLVVSAFVVPSVWDLWVLVPLVWAYGAVQRWLGRAGVVTAAVFGHIGATLLVATMLTAGIVHGRLALAQARAADVGVSYGLVTAVGLLTAQLAPRPRRLAEAAGSVLAVLVLMLDRSFTDLGHLAAWLIGLGLAVLVRRGRSAAAGRP